MNPKLVNNGLRSFAFHAQQRRPTVDAFDMSVEGDAARSTPEMDPEMAARMYIQQALASPAVPELTAAEVKGQKPEFRLLGVEKIPLTGTQTVKFRQQYRGIPVYGSLITVELDEDNRLLALNSALAEPDIDPVAEISVKDALNIIRKAAGYPNEQPLDIVPKLHYYYAPGAQEWYLVYVAEDVVKFRPKEQVKQHDLPELVDFVVCAHTGKLVSELPRTMTAEGDSNGAAPAPAVPPAPDVPAGWQVQALQVTDELNQPRTITVITNGANIRLYDPGLKVYTHDFRFQDIHLHSGNLPGHFAEHPPTWAEGAISAHANAADVARFLKDVLKRNGLDNLGGTYVSSIRCCSVFLGGQAQAWHNAAWTGKQMVYGQRRITNGNAQEWRSYSRAADVVAHEIAHGLTSATARLHYEGMSGALNESYSDIFGILITNYQQADRTQWNWQMGEDLSDTGVPLRDLSNPGLGQNPPKQPAHMNDYRELPSDQDHGGVHINSGIHNKAFHNLAMARGASGQFLLDNTALAALFYLALTQYLSRTSGFGDSRRAVELVARTLFRNDPDALRDQKLAAVAQAFEDVGITDTPA